MTQLGLFYKADQPKRKPRVKAPPPIPNTGWTAPTQYPNLSAAKIISLDTETKDPNLLTHGPGWARNDGHIVGFSLATEDNHAWYFPLRHEVEPNDNLDPAVTLRWLNDVLSNPHQPKVGANIMYDIGWLRQEGVTVQGRCYDVQFAEALIDEQKFSYSLDNIAKAHLDTGKDTNLLYQWCAEYYGGKPTSEQGKNFYRTPPRLMGPYAEKDAVLPAQLLPIQWQILDNRNMTYLFDLECRLIPLLIDMRYRGVRVDIPQAERVREKLLNLEAQQQKELNSIAGRHVDIFSNNSIAAAFDGLGIKYNLTNIGNPSFPKEWLEHHDAPIAAAIVKLRKYQKTRSTFIENAILDKNINGRLHTQFHPLRNDSGGTVSGRFSSQTPNLQQVPARDIEMALLLRSCFLPDIGFPYWWRGDYSQIEYRLLAHFAIGPGAEQIRQRYIKDPSTDYHAATTVQIKEITGVELQRKPTKNINFGLCYGMGKNKLRKTLGVTREQGEKLFTAYHRGVPFVSATFNACIQETEITGVATTILNRQTHFDYFVPRNDRFAPPFKYETAANVYGTDLVRAGTHRSLNRRLQGSAADIMKKGMVDAYESGVFDEMGGVPHLTVHDELDNSYHPDYYAASMRLKQCMEDAIKLKVPVVVDIETGTNWGNVQ